MEQIEKAVTHYHRIRKIFFKKYFHFPKQSAILWAKTGSGPRDAVDVAEVNFGMKIWKRFLPAALAMLVLSGCAVAQAPVEAPGEPVYIDAVELAVVSLEDETVALAEGPVPASDLLLPVASGTKTKKNNKAVIDYSNVGDGYVMVQFTAETTKRLKARVTGPSGDPYTYNINQGEWTTFPLSDGNGEYKVTVFEHTGVDSKYATVLSATFQVNLKDEFAPFLRPNQYVNYVGAVNSIAKAGELVKDIEEPLDQVAVIYQFVVDHLTYDKDKAATVQSGYLPVLDEVLEAKKGICFDYAALMTGMLRSQGVPCKLVVGYAGTAYHAWVSVWTEETGWVEGAIYFDGQTWHRMDPTFASSGKGSEAIMKYIGDGTNYTTKYLY